MHNHINLHRLKRTLLAPAVVLMALLSSIATTMAQRVPNKVRGQIKSHFVPLEYPVWDSSRFRSALAEMVGGKSIVGIGESTHGTYEFERAQSALTRMLIEDSGFNTVILAECNFADTRPLNDYVLYGEGDALNALTHINHFFETPTVEALKMVEAIREHNRGKPVEDRVWLFGADVKYPNGSARDALAYCRELGIKLPEEALQTLSSLAYLPVDMFFEDYIAAHPLDRVHRKLAPVYRLFERPAPGGLSAEMSWVRQSASVLRYAVNAFYVSFGEKRSKKRYRDSAMYNNVEWARAARPGSKIIVFAHNVHVEKARTHKGVSKYTRLGWLLEDRYQGRYFTIALDAAQGTFWAGGKRVLNIPTGRRKMTAYIESTVGHEQGILNLGATGDIKDFFNRKNWITYGTIGPRASLFPTEQFTDAFDALFYVRNSSPLRHIRFEEPPELYGMGLVVEPPEVGQGAISSGEVELSVSCSYRLRGEPVSIEGFCATLAFQTEDGKFLDYKAMPLRSGEPCGQTFKVPAGTASFTLNIRGHNALELDLEKVTVNGVPMDLGGIKVYSRKYRAAFVEGGSYRGHFNGESLVVELE